ncbi:MAG TPA: DegT/DnrJ/EryC1/StrS family aminotransferase [Bryobacteraceae bacterium]|nr:DegT/DnrJ/EryC1/StrS family aminotransferase [Bryobacteraceae bacterium]
MISILDIRRQTSAIRDQLDAAIGRVLDHGQFILGPEVGALEEAIAGYCGTRFAVGCASGSDALLLSLMALGIGRGDRVVTTPFTFFASAGSIAETGATPAFVDIDPVSFNMDPSRLEELLKSGAGGVKAIVPVHLFGECAEMTAINEIAGRFGIPVIEDAAQAIGAEFEGARAGSLGRCGCFSFFPTKNLGAFGDGGMITTDDPTLADKLRMLRVHGSRTKYYHEAVGINSRLDTLQAAILSVKMQYLEEWTEGRRANAAVYRACLAGSGITLPVERRNARHVYNQFTVRVEDRDEVKRRLFAWGVGSEVYYPVPLHLQDCFLSLGYREGDFPQSEAAAREVLSLPIEAGLSRADIETASGALRGSL